MFTIRTEDRENFIAEMDKLNARYNEFWKCPTSKLGAANYHTRLAFCDVHSTRDAFSYASLLMMTGREEDAKRAYDVL